jgi:DNA-directed RNA polymerase alpha subunit
MNKALDGLSARTRNCLFRRFGSDVTLEQITKATASELLGEYNFGRRSLDEVRKWLQIRGLDLVPPLPPMAKTKTVEMWAAALRKRGWTVIPPDED